MMTLTKRPKASESWSPEDMMEAIARGVAARFEERTGHSRKIINETVGIARVLGVAGREIEKWVNRRTALLAREEARLEDIKARLGGLGVKSYA